MAGSDTHGRRWSVVPIAATGASRQAIRVGDGDVREGWIWTAWWTLHLRSRLRGFARWPSGARRDAPARSQCPAEGRPDPASRTMASFGQRASAPWRCRAWSGGFSHPMAPASVASDVVPEPLPMRLEPQLIVPDRAPVLGANAGSVARPADALGISRERGVWRIQADSASRHDVARTLAELSGT